MSFNALGLMISTQPPAAKQAALQLLIVNACD